MTPYHQSANSGSFAYYRLPYADEFVTIESDAQPMLLPSVARIGEEAGFVVAPFMADAEHPIVLIRPDRISYERCKTGTPPAHNNKIGVKGDKTAYLETFGRFHKAVEEGEYKKLVLARCGEMDVATSREDLRLLFQRAYMLYPRLMIMLFSTPQTGTWIVASPEILIDGKGSNLHTIALAGTMPYEEGYPDWSEKNKGEQHIVERYIEDTITPLCGQVTKDGPVTMRAGNLVHLRSDFRFIINANCSLGQLIARLHPTPAVCGMPKEDAIRFIVENEGVRRSYYSGFAGLVGINGETHLYVSLRCAKLDEKVTLYAGGGIMPESNAEAEWLETERKMETIKYVFE